LPQTTLYTLHRQGYTRLTKIEFYVWAVFLSVIFRIANKSELFDAFLCVFLALNTLILLVFLEGFLSVGALA